MEQNEKEEFNLNILLKQRSIIKKNKINKTKKLLKNKKGRNNKNVILTKMK